MRRLGLPLLFLALAAGPSAGQDVGPAPKQEPAPGGLVDIPDPTDGGVYHVPPGLVEAVKARIAAKQRQGPKAMPAAPAAATGQGDLAEVNAQRAQRGLRPYHYDPQLTEAAQRAANYRAANRIEGHCNDFSFLPAGVHAGAAGCAAWRPGTGFGACDLYANWTFCGAASAIGADGRRYCHAFFRN